MSRPRMSLAEMCRLVAYYGDISEANRARWRQARGTRMLQQLLRDADEEKPPEAVPGAAHC